MSGFIRRFLVDNLQIHANLTLMSSMQPTTELKAYFEPTLQWWGRWQVDLSKYLVSQKVLISWRSFGRSKAIYIYRLPWERAIPVPIPHNFLNITSKPELDTKFANRQQTTVTASLKYKKLEYLKSNGNTRDKKSKPDKMEKMWIKLKKRKNIL